VSRVDARLALLAAGCWLSAYLSMVVGSAAALALTGIAAVSVAVTWRRSVVCLALIGVAVGAGATGARLAVRDAAAGLAGREGRVELVVSDDPRVVAGRSPTWAVAARLSQVDEIRVDARALVLAGDAAWAGLLPGQRVRTKAKVQPPRGGDLTAVVLSIRDPPELVGRAPWPQRAAGSLREGLRKACAGLEPQRGGLLPGLVVGDTSRLPDSVREDFQAAGMTHLTAVSGSNVALVVGCLLLLLRWCRAGPRLSAAVCVLGVVGFVILARPSPSVLRAAVMGALALVALATGRQRAAFPALCATVVVLLAVDPGLAVDAGFALSVCATAGLLLLAPGWRDALRQRGFPRGAAEALAVPAAAQVTCGPVVAGLSGSVSLVAIPANLLATAAIVPATILGVVAAALSPLWPSGAAGAAWLASWPAWWLVTVARVGAGLPLGSLPFPSGTPGALLLTGLTILLLLGFRSAAIRRVVLVVALACVVGAVPVRVLAPGWPPPGWLMVACDVGQGDAIVLRVGDGSAAVVDAGPEPGPVDDCLSSLGISSVPLLVISHFHVDHIGGVAGVFRGRRVGSVWLPAYAEPAAGRDAVLAAAHGVPVATAFSGGGVSLGQVTLTVAGPAATLHGTRSDPNNNSLVLLAVVGDVRLLLAGDAEVEEQRELVAAGGIGRIDVLKVAHHGSSFQDMDFLDSLRPRIAVVSVGAGNVYGHPNASVLARLSRGGARVVRTDQEGAIAIGLDNGSLFVTVGGHTSAR
jgi:competence protein ComEC